MEITSETAKEIEDEKEKEELKKIEAILFISGRFLSMPELVSLSDSNPIIIKENLEILKEKYNKETSAIEITEKADKWKMSVKPEYGNITTKLAGGTSEFTKSEQETLAIIALKQPIKQSVVIKIRSNKAYEHIKKFVELGFVLKKRKGHTEELTLADDFYNYFDISQSEASDFLKQIPTEE